MSEFELWKCENYQRFKRCISSLRTYLLFDLLESVPEDALPGILVLKVVSWWLMQLILLQVWRWKLKWSSNGAGGDDSRFNATLQNLTAINLSISLCDLRFSQGTTDWFLEGLNLKPVFSYDSAHLLCISTFWHLIFSFIINHCLCLWQVMLLLLVHSWLNLCWRLDNSGSLWCVV